MGTQTAIADEIRERGADYVLCVKDNHPKLLDSILLAQARVGGALQATSNWESHNTGHGREEWCRCWAFEAGDWLYQGDQCPHPLEHLGQDQHQDQTIVAWDLG